MMPIEPWRRDKFRQEPTLNLFRYSNTYRRNYTREKNSIVLEAGYPQSGLSIVELLVVLAVLGIMVGLGAMMFSRQNEVVTLESAASELSQTLFRARSQALQRGDDHRVRIVNASNYALEFFEASSWQTARSVELPSGVAVVAPEVGSSVTFDTRGFADFSPVNIVFSLSDGTRNIRIVPAMTGTTRVQ